MTAEAQNLATRLEAHFQDVYVRAMADVPICNPALAVACVGFREWSGRALGIVVTPWFMNILLLPLEGSRPIDAAPGATQSVAFPCGRIDFLAGDLDGFGRVLMCSLFSPMDEFADQEAALATAQAALEGILDSATLADTPDRETFVAPAAQRKTPVQRAEDYRRIETAETPELDRRALLRGGFAASRTPP
jgi:[NiFe] hydrogenase assembly HybE family chaperone